MAQASRARKSAAKRGRKLARRPPVRRPRYPMPADVRKALSGHGMMAAYRARPPYQRNDYLWWINQAARADTRGRRIAQMLDELARGGRYMKMPYRARKTRRPARRV